VISMLSILPWWTLPFGANSTDAVGEAADRGGWWAEGGASVLHCVGGGQVAVLDGVRHEHEAGQG